MQVARCISQLNVQMSRLSCGTRSRSNSFSPSPSRSPSLSSYLSASTSPRSGPSPINNFSSRLKTKEQPSQQQSPRKMPRKLVRSLTMPNAEQSSLLPVKVLFPSSNEFEDRYPSTKVPNLATKLKNQMFADFQAKLSAKKGEPRRNKTYPPSAVQGRTFSSSANRPDQLRINQARKGFDSVYKGAKPKTMASQAASADVVKCKAAENAPTSAKPKKSSNALSQTVTTVLPLLPKKKSKKKHGNRSVGGSVKSEQLLLKVGTFSRVINAMKK